MVEPVLADIVRQKKEHRKEGGHRWRAGLVGIKPQLHRVDLAVTLEVRPGFRLAKLNVRLAHIGAPSWRAAGTAELVVGFLNAPVMFLSEWIGFAAADWVAQVPECLDERFTSVVGSKLEKRFSLLIRDHVNYFLVQPLGIFRWCNRLPLTLSVAVRSRQAQQADRSE